MADNKLNAEDSVKNLLGDEGEFNHDDFKSNNETHDDDFDQLLRDFIFAEDADEEDTPDIANMDEMIEYAKKQEQLQNQDDLEFANDLREQEKPLFEAYGTFRNAIIEMAQEKGIKKPKFSFNPKTLHPKYKPNVGRQITTDTILGWDIMIQAHPSRIENIEPNASDEELLDFAERTTDDNLQMAVISYVEILIEIEGCEIDYERRRLKAKRKKIEKEIYLEHQRRAERAQKIIENIEKKKFPVNAERLVKNYLKTQKNDAESAYKALTTNPATFTPIEFDKIKPSFFGMLKVSPQDGIKINKKLGDFLKRLRI